VTEVCLKHYSLPHFNRPGETGSLIDPVEKLKFRGSILASQAKRPGQIKSQINSTREKALIGK